MTIQGPSSVGGFELRHDPYRVARTNAMAQLLRTGDIVPGSERPFPGIPAHEAPPMVVDVTDGTLTESAVVKTQADGAPGEAAEVRLARHAGVGALYGQAEQRADGTTLTELIPGKSWGQMGFRDANDLVYFQSDAYRGAFPDMPVHEARMRAMTDIGVFHGIQGIVGQNDRSPNNGRVYLPEKANDALRAVQPHTWLAVHGNGKLGWGETPLDPIRPFMPYGFMAPGDSAKRVRTIELHPAARDILGDTMTDAALEDAQRALRVAPDDDLPLAQRKLLQMTGSDWFLDRMMQRRDFIVDTGTVEYVANGARNRVLNAANDVLFPKVINPIRQMLMRG